MILVLKYIIPAAILWRVGTVIVSAFDCQCGYASSRLALWALSHVGKKCSEVVPSGTHSDTATAIVLKVYVSGIIATITHHRPHTVKRMDVTKAVSTESRTSYFSAQTTASLFVSAPKAVNVPIADRAAVAQALPDHAVTLSPFGWALGYKPAVAMPSDVKFGHLLYDIIKHVERIYERLKDGHFAECAPLSEVRA